MITTVLDEGTDVSSAEEVLVRNDYNQPLCIFYIVTVGVSPENTQEEITNTNV